MEIIIYDLFEEKLKIIYGIIDNSLVIINNKKIKSCIGCFYCWIKNLGECRIKDGYDNLVELYLKVEKIIIISRCCYGLYSFFIKNVLDRSILYLFLFFKIKNKEMYYIIRYKKKLYFELYFYGEDIVDEEKEIVKNMVKVNCINLNVINFIVFFLEIIS